MHYIIFVFVLKTVVSNDVRIAGATSPDAPGTSDGFQLRPRFEWFCSNSHQSGMPSSQVMLLSLFLLFLLLLL